MDQQNDNSDVESEAYLGDDDGQLDQQDQEVADLNGPEAGNIDMHCLQPASLCVWYQLVLHTARWGV